MASELISTSYFVNPSHQSVCLYVYLSFSLLGKGSVKCDPPFVSRQWFGKNITAATNTHATVELLDASLSMFPFISKESRWLVLPRTPCNYLSRYHTYRSLFTEHDMCVSVFSTASVGNTVRCGQYLASHCRVGRRNTFSSSCIFLVIAARFQPKLKY
jgi:hypothetical protein